MNEAGEALLYVYALNQLAVMTLRRGHTQAHLATFWQQEMALL